MKGYEDADGKVLFFEPKALFAEKASDSLLSSYSHNLQLLQGILQCLVEYTNSTDNTDLARLANKITEMDYKYDPETKKVGATSLLIRLLS